MKIAINLLRFNPKVNIGGNYTFAYNVVKELIHQNNDKNKYYLLISEESKEMFDYGDLENVTYVFRKQQSNIFFQLINENLFILKKINLLNIDLFYSPCFLLPLKKIKIPTICTIHDLNFKYISQGLLKDMYKNIIYKKTLKNANIITTISNYTKTDIINNFHIDEEKIITIYNGTNIKKNIDINSLEGFKNKYGIDGNYIFTMSHHSHKNAELAISAFKKCKLLLNFKYKLVITGAKRGYKQKLQEMVELNEINKDVVFIDYIENEYLPLLYNQANLFLFPSLFEGFGLPVIEAMKMGCPVIASNCTSLPEVIGDGGLVLDVNNVELWAQTITTVLNNETIKENLIKKGYERAKLFNWEKTAQEISLLF